MNIGLVAKRSGISSKMVRHYEEIGLITHIARNESGYRIYSEKELHSLIFIKQARNLGFSVEQIRQLLNLWQDKHRASQTVKQLALQHIEELDSRIRELQDMKELISKLADSCHGDERPDCPILDSLTEPSSKNANSNSTQFGIKK